MTLRIGLLPQVAAAHFVSHLHIMVLAALFPLLPAFFQVDYVKLGLALSLFNIVTALVQAPMGFAVDRFGAMRLLRAALALGSSSLLLIAVAPSYFCLLLGMALAGVANAIYHPADYALLSRHIDPAHIGKAFSVHTFAGFLGAAVAPVFLLSVAVASSPAMAFAAAALVGFATLAVLWVQGSALPQATHVQSATPAGQPAVGRLALLSPMVVSLTVLFVLLNLSTGAIEKFSVAALMQGQGVALNWANSALTAFLFASAFGVLAGGTLADRTQRHGVVAASAFALATLLMMLVATTRLNEPALLAVLGVTGFLTGVIAPSRDMLVRAAAPKGAEGKTFGIVSTGFNIGGTLGPVGFGWLLDQGHPTGIFWGSAAFMGLTVAVTLLQERALANNRKTSVLQLTYK
ncbi:MFS transporter [Pseudomonas sp. S60]|uniref:MFS transporter n=1 Tax=Pseudomonas sp. S60 TaxID=211124 RepID=UPI0019113BDC|nr:MFS transporter [Pseudomonas sp. S60]MBK5010485.1 MFS transporter [Pseudomonas sp. S60]